METNTEIALIGCGRISGHHCRSIQEVPGVKLSAVCDLDQEKALAYSKQYGVPAYTNYHEMFQKHPEIGVVAIVTPSGMHYEHSLEILAQYKKHLIVEKPTFMKPSQVSRVYAAAREIGVSIFPVFQNRHNLAVQRVLRGLKNGELGKVRVVSVRVRWCRPQRYYELAPWRGTFSHDGGALTNQGVHHVDLCRLLAGEVKQATAKMVTLGAHIEVEDTVVGAMEFTSGAVGNLEVTTSARPKDYEASLSLVCENGLAQLGGIAVNELQIYTPDPQACQTSSEDFGDIVYGHGHAVLYREIAAFFREGKPFSVQEEDCLNTIRLLDAFYRADEAGGWVQVRSPEESTRLGRADSKISDLYRTRK